MIAYGIKEKDLSGSLYSTCVLIDQGEVLGYYRKEHPPCAVQSEWRLIAATHNLLKLWRSGEWTRP